MPLPFIVAGIAAAVGAVSAGAAAGVAVVGTAVATGAALTAAAGATAVAIAGTTILTVGGIAITAGAIAGVAAGAAIAFGISEVVMEESQSYANSYISDSEKKREKERLEKLYQEQLQSLEKLKLNESSPELKNGIISTIENSKKFLESEEYYNAINFIKDFKLVYAENKKNENIANEVKEIINNILEVRRETLSLRGESDDWKLKKFRI